MFVPKKINEEYFSFGALANKLFELRMKRMRNILAMYFHINTKRIINKMNWTNQTIFFILLEAHRRLIYIPYTPILGRC